MEFQPGAVTLNDVIGGTLGAGVVPFPRYTEQEDEFTSTGVITVLNTWTNITTFALTGLSAGDRIIMCGKCQMEKGAVAGDNDYRFQMPSGTATIRWFDSNTSYGVKSANFPALTVDSRDIFCIAEVNGAGWANIDFEARSLGSNSSCAIGGTGAYIVVLPGS